MKIAVIGASGLIGSHLLAHLRQNNSDTIGTSFSKKDSKLTFFDIRSSNLDSLALEDQGYSSVIITAALSNIYFCETNAALSHEVNVRGTLTLLEQLAKTSLQSIFLSSDYVFDGKTGSYTETSPTNPTTEYGKQKNIVEKTIPTLTDNYLIVRASKIFGTTRNDGTFIDNIAKDLSAGKKMRVAYDQIFCPTFVEEFATSLLVL